MEVARLNNIGVAFMNQQLPERALQRFTQAGDLGEKTAVPLLNRGIALFYLHKVTEAEAALNDATGRGETSAPAWYCLGLLHLQQGDPGTARADFQRAATAAPNDADTHYFLGTANLQLRDYQAAQAEFENTLRRNPLHASAEFGLARALQHTGAAEAARVHLARFKQLSEQKNGETVSATYSEQGPSAMVREMSLPVPSVSPMIPVRFVPKGLANATSASPGKEDQGAGLCIMDLQMDPQGKSEKAVLAIGDGPEVLRGFALRDGNLTALDLKAAGLSLSGHGLSCAVGDYDNDGLPDLAVALSDRVVLFHNLGHGHFADVTAQVGLKATNRPAGVTFVDFDHDGDLDLFLTGAPLSPDKQPNVLWRNNGNGSFTEWTSPTALGGAAATSAAALSDLNNDRAIDLVTAGIGGAPAVYLNQREGAFTRSALYASGTLSGTRGVAVADFNKDGWMDVALTHTGAPGVSLWRNLQGNGFANVPLPLEGVRSAWGLTPVDVDNDGWIDLAMLVDTAQGTRLRVLRNRGPEGFEDISDTLGLRALPMDGARSLVAADLRGRGASDLIVGRLGAAPLLLENEGATRHHSLRIQLAGLADNKSAIGTKVEVFADGLWQKFEVGGSSGFESQGALEVVAGLGDHSKADIVRLLWPTGVPQDELEVATTAPLALRETDRRGSSCPVLFAWDGKEFRFVSDVIGAAVIGHWISPTARNASDADEWIKVDGALLQPHDGQVRLRLGEPMEEINYIDHLRLVAVDHPANTEVYPNERFLSERPFADGRLMVASESTHRLAGAWDDAGQDVSELLRSRDHRYVKDFTNLPYAGFATPHALTLDLGAWTPAHPLRLFLHGFIEYFSASSMYAAWQAGIQPQSPSVEAQLPDGTWKLVVGDMGFPAGLPRTIVVDLSGKLPAGTRRIRLRTNLQIYWDQVLVDNGAESSAAARESELPLSSATLAFRGYPRQIDGATPGDLTYDYKQISATGPFGWQRGTYTRYGEVAPLLQTRDNRYAIFGSGEEIEASFRVSDLPPLPRAWKRDYFFYADGFVKDMDFYEALPFTVAELPFHAMSTYPYQSGEHYPESRDDLAYQLEWNDRFESGKRLQSFGFHYGAEESPAAPAAPRAIAADPAKGGTR